MPTAPTIPPVADVKRSRSTGEIVGLAIAAALGILFLVGGVFVVWSAFHRSQEPRRQSLCGNNLKQITFALSEYETQHGRCPPAFIADTDGKPLLSWRVLLLPYLGERELFRRFHLDEPWDSPHNRPLAAEMPQIFRCPSDLARSPEHTSYVLITGAGTLFEPGKAVRTTHLRRAAAEIIVVAESAESGIVWTEPRDVDVESLRHGFDAPAGQGLRSAHPEAVVIAYADGAVIHLPKNTSPDELRQSVSVK